MSAPLRVSLWTAKGVGPSLLAILKICGSIAWLLCLLALPLINEGQKHSHHPSQAERPEDDPDVRGGGRAAEDARIVKGADYASDDEEPLRNEDNVRLKLFIV